MLTDTKELVERRSKRAWKRWYTDQEKLEAVKLYLITGNQAVTAAALGLNKNTMSSWVNSQWFRDLSVQVKNEGRIALSQKLMKIAGKALDTTMDRLENGEWIYDQKLGEMRRKPMGGRDAHKIAVDFLDKAWEVEEQGSREISDQQASNRLQELADAFAAMARKTVHVEVVDVVPTEKQALPGPTK